MGEAGPEDDPTNPAGSRCVIIIMMRQEALHPVVSVRRAIGAVIAALLGLLMLGCATGAAATAKEHHVHQSAGHRQRHASATGPPFCGRAIIPMAPGYSKPLAPSNAKPSATLLPCYKLELPGGVRTTRP